MKAALAVLLVVLCAALPAAAGAATLSDSYAGRETVQGLPLVVAGSTVGAGREAGEPVPKPLSPADHSVWLEWEATSSGFVTVSTCGSAVPTVLGVYQGPDLEHLTELRSVSSFGVDCTPISHGATFQVFAGLKYEIVVDGNSFFVPPGAPSNGEGAVSLQLEATPPPPNDAFATPTELVGSTSEEPGGPRFYLAETFGYNWGATTEPGEPPTKVSPEPPSVWYRWAAPESGQARVDVGGALGRQVWLGVYAGDRLDSLQEIGSGADYVELAATAGTVYRVVVEGASGSGAEGMGGFGVRVSMRLAPASAPAPATASKAPLDLQPPGTSLGRRKVRSGARSASFAFSASEPGSSFRCKLDARKEVPCTSPKAYSRLAYGRHTFKVRAVDAAGNADPSAASTRFSIARPQRHHR